MKQNKNYTPYLGLILGVLSAVLLVLTGAWRAVPPSIMGTADSSAPIYTNQIMNISSTPPTFMGAPTFTSSTSTSAPIFVTTPTMTTSTVSSTGMGVEMCTDGVDNDGDMEIDCNDADCAYFPSCHTSAPTPGQVGPESLCGNNIDDDMDGSMDCDDTDCMYACMNGSTNSTGMQVAPAPLMPAPTSTVSPDFWQDASEEPEGSYIDPFYTPLIDDTYLEPYNYDLVPEAMTTEHSAPAPMMTEKAQQFRNSFIPFLPEP